MAAGGSTLEAVLKAALKQCPQPIDTKFAYSSTVEAHIASRSPDSTGAYITIYSAGRKAGTVQAGGAKVGRQPPPKGQEFLRTGIYIKVSGNNLAYVADGHTNDGQITLLLQKFFEHAKRPKRATQFGLYPKGDKKLIKELIKSGVKTIDLGLASYLPTVKQLNEDAKKSGAFVVIDPLLKALSALGKAAANQSETDAMSDIEATIHLGYDGRTSNQLVPQLMSKLANQVADANDEFKIVTRDGNIITRSKIAIRADVDISGDDIALDPQDAFKVLSGVMKQWKTAGVFDS